MNEVFEDALKTGKIAGAYLIEGASKDAVEADADAFLMRLFCETGTACGICGGCLKYTRRSHVDLLEISAGGKSIKVDAVRDIPAFVANKPYEDGYKAILIPEAHMMTDQAQNALLKVLEEPPVQTVFVLGTCNSKNILPTLLSRCIILKTPRNVEDAEKRLMDGFSLSTLKARVLLRVANGDYYLAKKYAETDYFGMREDMILALNRIFTAKSMATSAIEKLFLKYEHQLPEAAEVALVYLKDVLEFKYTRQDDLTANSDKLEEIKKHVQVRDYILVNTSERLSTFVVKSEQCPGMNKKLELTGMLFNILEVVI